MLVADANTNPYFKELCDAAKEIAELKAQISRLEKVVDGVLAQHLAGQDQFPAAVIAPDAPHHVADHDTERAGPDSDDLHDDDHKQDVVTHHEASPAGEIFVAEDLPAAKAPQVNDWDLPSDDDAITCADTADQARVLTPEDDTGIDAIATTDDNLHTSPTTGSLPSALLSLICRPLKSALTSPDDLTLIKGIDCATALELAAHGLSGFEDIAHLDTQKIDELCAVVAGAERLHKQVWIEQAAILAKGNLTSYARQTRADRKLEDTTFTLKPELISLESALEDKAPDFAASEIIIDEKISFERLAKDQAASVLNDLATRDMPRQMHIDRQLTNINCCKEDGALFFPMSATDADFAVEKIAHVAPRSESDFGSMRALAASLGAAAVIYIATATSGAFNVEASVAQIMQTDVCALTSWSPYPDACKQILGKVL